MLKILVLVIFEASPARDQRATADRQRKAESTENVSPTAKPSFEFYVNKILDTTPEEDIVYGNEEGTKMTSELFTGFFDLTQYSTKLKT